MIKKTKWVSGLMTKLEDDDMNDNSFGWDDWYDEPKGE